MFRKKEKNREGKRGKYLGERKIIAGGRKEIEGTVKRPRGPEKFLQLLLNAVFQQWQQMIQRLRLPSTDTPRWGTANASLSSAKIF